MDSPQQAGSREHAAQEAISHCSYNTSHFIKTQSKSVYNKLLKCVSFSVFFLLEMLPHSVNKQKLWRLTGDVHPFENSSFTRGASCCFIVTPPIIVTELNDKVLSPHWKWEQPLPSFCLATGTSLNWYKGAAGAANGEYLHTALAY